MEKCLLYFLGSSKDISTIRYSRHYSLNKTLQAGSGLLNIYHIVSLGKHTKYQPTCKLGLPL